MIPPGARHTYLIAHWCKSLVWHGSGLLFAFFLTETCGRAPRAMGLLLGGSLLAHAAADVVVGGMAQRRIGSVTDAAAAQARWAPWSSLFFAGSAAPPLLPPPLRLGFALATLICFRFAFAAMDVPQNAIVAFYTADPSVQAQLLADRNIVSGSANLAATLIAAPILIAGHHDAVLRHGAWAAVIALAAAGSAWWLRRLVGDAPIATGPSTHATAVPVPAMAMLLSVAGLLVFAATIFRAMEPYVAAYAGIGIGIMVWVAIGTILSQPFWLVAQRAGPARSALIASACTAISAAALLGSGRTTTTGTMVAGLGFGIGNGGLWLMVWAAAMRHASAGGATYAVGVFTAASKLAQGLATIGLGEVLHGSSYRQTLADPGSPTSLAMSASVVVTALCGLVLALSGRRRDQTAAATGSTTLRPRLRRLRDRSRPRPGRAQARGRPSAQQA